MKLVYDNIIYSLQKAGGISVYWSEIIKRASKKCCTTFYESNNENLFRKEIDISHKSEGWLKYNVLRYLPFLKKIKSKSIFHSSYYRVSLQKDIVNIVTVHDFTYEFYSTGLAKYVHMLQKNFAVKQSDGIICVSENTKKDLIKFYPNINEEKIRVVYNGVSDEFVELPTAKELLHKEFEQLIDKKYILYIGDRSDYKNFNIAINVLEESSDYFLVVIGGKLFSEKELNLIKNIDNRLFHFRGVSNNQLNILYNNAFCLLYPSSYEGFGIPIIEAMRTGCPVVSTNMSSIPEVAGDAGLLVDKIELNLFIEQIKKLENKNVREALKPLCIQQAFQFSWERCFNETYEFYNEIWNMKFNK